MFFSVSTIEHNLFRIQHEYSILVLVYYSSTLSNVRRSLFCLHFPSVTRTNTASDIPPAPSHTHQIASGTILPAVLRAIHLGYAVTELLIFF